MMKKVGGVALAAVILLALTHGPSVAQTQSKPTDPQIVKMLIVGAQLEVDYANIALQQSKSEAVRRFAQRMVTDHSAVVDNTTALSQRLAIPSADSPISTLLATGGDANKAKLHALSGAEFDKFYVDNEVRFHKVVIDTTKNVLAPSSQNPELKTAVESWLPMYERHEQHALMLQAAQQHSDGGAGRRR